MKTMKLASLAGLAASIVMTQLEMLADYQPASVAVAQPQPTRPPTRSNPSSPTTNPGGSPNATQPNTGQQTRQNPGSPTTNPRTVPLPADPNAQPGANPANPNQPGATGAATGTGVAGTTTTDNAMLRQRFFALTNPQSEAQLNMTGQKLVRIEQQFATNNQNLLKQLGQARQLQGQRREDAMAEVMQSMLQQQVQLQQHLVDLRMMLTGQLEGDGTAANQPGATPTFNPGTTNDTRLNPGAPSSNPVTPRSPTGVTSPGSTPATNPATTPTTNPATPGNTGTPR